MFDQLLGSLIQFDIVGEQAGAFHAHAFQVARKLFAARGELLDLRF